MKRRSKIFLFLLCAICAFSEVHHFELSEGNKMQREFFWQMRDVGPYDELLLSWNGARPAEGRFAFLIRVEQNGDWSPWLYYGEWGSLGQLLFNDLPPGSFATARREHIKVSQEPATGFEIHVIASGGARMEQLRNLTVSLNQREKRQEEEPLFSSVLLENVPRQAQLSSRHARYQDLSFPCSASVVLNFLLKENRVNPSSFAREVMEEDSEYYESWALNIAQMSHYLGPEYRIYSDRASHFKMIHDQLLQNLPVLVAIRGFIPGAARSYLIDHIVVVIGYDAETNSVDCIDPGFPTDKSTFVRYPFKEFEEARAKQGNRVCFIAKKLTFE